MANSSRRTIALSEVELVLIKEGLTIVRKNAIAAGDDFKGVFAKSTLSHVQVVLDKMNNTADQS